MIAKALCRSVLMTTWICIRQFEWRQHAERAKSILDAEAIIAVLMHDDAGGWEGGPPSMPESRTRLMVPEDDSVRAAKALESVRL